MNRQFLSAPPPPTLDSSGPMFESHEGKATGTDETPAGARAAGGRCPPVSIGLPVYNGARFLRQAIDSLRNQDFADFELILSDNHSTDATPDICQDYARTDSRIRYVRADRNRGAAWNFNRVVELSSGRYFKWVACDDVCEPPFLRACVEVLDSRPEVVLVYPREGGIDADDRYLGPRPYRLNTNLDSPCHRLRELFRHSRGSPPVFGLVRTEVLKRTAMLGGYDASDQVLLAELALHGRFHEIPRELLLHREHDERSVRLCPDRHSATIWFNPAKQGRLLFPAWRWLGGYLAAIHHAPLSRSQRWACYAQLAGWARMHYHRLAEDLVIVMKQLATRMLRPRRPEHRAA